MQIAQLLKSLYGNLESAVDVQTIWLAKDLQRCILKTSSRYVFSLDAREVAPGSLKYLSEAIKVVNCLTFGNDLKMLSHGPDLKMLRMKAEEKQFPGSAEWNERFKS